MVAALVVGRRRDGRAGRPSLGRGAARRTAALRPGRRGLLFRGAGLCASTPPTWPIRPSWTWCAGPRLAWPCKCRTSGSSWTARTRNCGSSSASAGSSSATTSSATRLSSLTAPARPANRNRNRGWCWCEREPPKCWPTSSKSSTPSRRKTAASPRWRSALQGRDLLPSGGGRASPLLLLARCGAAGYEPGGDAAPGDRGRAERAGRGRTAAGPAAEGRGGGSRGPGPLAESAGVRRQPGGQGGAGRGGGRPAAKESACLVESHRRRLRLGGAGRRVALLPGGAGAGGRAAGGGPANAGAGVAAE